MKADKRKDRLFDPRETERVLSLAGLPLASFGQRAGAFLSDVLLILATYVPARVAVRYLLIDRLQVQEYLYDSAHSDVDSVDVAVLRPLRLGDQRLHAGQAPVPHRIISLSHHRITLWQAAERALGYGASLLDAGSGFFQFFVNPNRCVHDRIAETIVIKHSARPNRLLTRAAPLCPSIKPCTLQLAPVAIPQRFRMRIEDHPRASGRALPQPARNFVLELCRRPADVSCVDASRGVVRNRRFARHHENIVHDVRCLGRLVARAEQRARPQRDRSAEENFPAARAVENQADGAVGIRMNQQHQRLPEIGVVRFLGGDQNRAGRGRLPAADLLRQRQQKNYSWHSSTIFPLTAACSSS